MRGRDNGGFFGAWICVQGVTGTFLRDPLRPSREMLMEAGNWVSDDERRG